MKAIAAILAAALCATPIAESRAESPEHPQGPSRFGRGLNLLDQFEGTFPLHAGDELVGKIAGVKVRLKLSDCTDVKPKRSDDPDQSGGGLRAAHCLVSASKPAPAHAKVPICDGSDTVPVVLVQGHWQTTKDHTSGGITAGCSVKEIADVNSWKQPWTSALAKCVELWKTHANSSLLTACIHMARAAYDGGEDDYTWPGTMVDAWDTIVDQQHVKGKQHRPGCWMVDRKPVKYGALKTEICEMWLEAEWDTEGARCVNHPRWCNLPSKVKTVFKDPIPETVSRPLIHCRSGLQPTAWTAQPPGPGALFINRSKLNVFPGTELEHTPECEKYLPGGKDSEVKDVQGSHFVPPPTGSRKKWDTEQCATLCGG